MTPHAFHRTVQCILYLAKIIGHNTSTCPMTCHVSVLSTVTGQRNCGTCSCSCCAEGHGLISLAAGTFKSHWDGLLFLVTICINTIMRVCLGLFESLGFFLHFQFCFYSVDVKVCIAAYWRYGFVHWRTHGTVSQGAALPRGSSPHLRSMKTAGERRATPGHLLHPAENIGQRFVSPTNCTNSRATDVQNSGECLTADCCLGSLESVAQPLIFPFPRWERKKCGRNLPEHT